MVMTLAPRSMIVPFGVLRGTSTIASISWTFAAFSFFSSLAALSPGTCCFEAPFPSSGLGLLAEAWSASASFFSSSAFFLLVLFLWRLERDGVKGLAEETRTYRPGDGFAVVGPVKIVGTDVGQFLERDARRVDVDREGLTPHFGHGRQVELVHHLGQHPLPIRARAHFVGRYRFLGKEETHAGHFEVHAAIGAVEPQRNQALVGVDVDAVLLMGEVRPAHATCRENQIGLTALSGNPHQIRARGLSEVELPHHAIVR